ncbi:putative Pseudouridine synthase, Rsu:RNA-binding S4:Pseudouridine synthase [Bradyrhizobium sp. STM 3843]|uniref:pseudouridine synthase n=1 Tax=Bradyrhizobium sp. STM 3843 TaxID=551947 RepID=UPI000240724E|nr:pseudouridine synthase [Bradyrhizobium sp. STM 3843]CCE06822.1 putative Pseudouridine synthase, Rsu:RNA-binding S4:Pseudouridine synthase [Bradyrhizobium sp. STM 3843]
MPRDTDKDNDSRGRRDRAPRARSEGGKGRSGAARGPDKKFAKRGFGAKDFGAKEAAGRGKRSFDEGRAPRRRDDGDAPRKSYGDKPRFNRDERPRGDRPFAARPARAGDGDKRAFKPRGDRPKFDRDERGGEKRPYKARAGRDEARPAGRSSDRKFGERKPYAARDRDGDKRPYAPRGEGSRDRSDRPRAERSFGDRPPRTGDRPERKFGGDRKFSRSAEGDRGERKFGAGARGPRKEFGDRPPRGETKPWQKRGADEDRPERGARPPREGGRGFDRPRSERGREDRPKFDRPKFDRPKFDKPKFDRPRDRDDERSFDRPRRRPEGRTDWQEHPRSERRDGDRFSDRPRRDNEDDSKVFAKRPAFGGRGPYRERKPETDRRSARTQAEPVAPKKTGERIAKVVARAGLASRRDAEEMITQGRVTVNGRVINSPALDVTENDVIQVDGQPLPERERTRLFLYHKPRGLMTTHSDPEGRPTVFDNLPEDLPRLISIGRLDFNTEGLLLLTNDGGLARVLELPETGWLRRYRVRAHGEVTQAQLDQLAAGVEVDGVKYGPIEATLERDQGANVWLVVAIREGKNREVRNVLGHLGLEVNRLIRVSYGPFQLGEIAEGEVQEIKSRVLREQLGEKVIAQAGADFGPAAESKPGRGEREPLPAPKPKPKREVVADRKGRRVLVQRTGSEEARARHEAEARFPGPPRRPKRGYHGKRDLAPRDE